MKTRLLLCLTVLIAGRYLLQAQSSDYRNIYLSHYTIESFENPLISTIVIDGKGNDLKLIGKTAELFEIRKDQLLLSKKGIAYFDKSERANLSIQIKSGRETTKKSFIILKDEFAQNKVIAHRGAWKNTGVPQNSIASLKAAINLGVAGSEFDIHLTADDVLVINHDPYFEGMTIEKTRYADLLKHSLKNGEPIPTLENYIKTGMLQQKTKLIAELKPSIVSKERSIKLAEKVVAMVGQLQAQAWMVYISFSYDILKKIVELQPGAQTQYLKGGINPEQLKADGIAGADYHFSFYQNNEQWIANAHTYERVVNGWTINDPLLMEYFLVHNIDLITTDEPEKLIQIVGKAKDKKYKLKWSDEFNGIGLPDSTKWSYQVGGHGWGNNELQYYTGGDSANIFIRDGVLQLTARQEIMENRNYTSARMITANKATFTYGKIEIRARLPKGRGLWPALWMLGASRPQLGWPACGEIDIMEHVGFSPDSVFGTIHTKAYNHMRKTQKGKKAFIEKPYDEFHLYAIEWTSEKIDFLLDGKVYNQILNEHKSKDEWPFDDPFYLIINLAIGGNLGGKMGVDDSIFPASLEVDYIRVFDFDE